MKLVMENCKTEVASHHGGTYWLFSKKDIYSHTPSLSGLNNREKEYVKMHSGWTV